MVGAQEQAGAVVELLEDGAAEGQGIAGGRVHDTSAEDAGAGPEVERKRVAAQVADLVGEA